uniref:Uncharacterized protein n=1 Tax=Ditylum brightwellii TaxID=49249 RepID=A0A7S4WBE7_9STRA|mmetsp:Transcript_28252/g.37599  ORF Transcript_28252/g.37599 Transcript_28252/m.37599 type:complete len:244 (-) Transcript_28252:84-815(-)
MMTPANGASPRVAMSIRWKPRWSFLSLLLMLAHASPVAAVLVFKRTVSCNRAAPSIPQRGNECLSQKRSNLSVRTAWSAAIPSQARQVIGHTMTKLSAGNGGDIDDDPSEPAPIDKFRSLMGTLYGVAGLAHAGDCYLGQSQLLAAAGSPPVTDLPPQGQLLVGIWCAAGPLAYAASKLGGRIADAGLVVYGLIEVAGGVTLNQYLLSGGSSGAVEIDAVTNALGVQAIVLASWLYSNNKQGS